LKNILTITTLLLLSHIALCETINDITDVNWEEYFGCGEVEVEYADVTGDRVDEALVIGCGAGTAGYELHSVATIDKGKVKILKSTLTSEEMIISGYDLRNEIFGNTNYQLHEEKGLLKAVWYFDATGRKEPLAIYYKWDGKAFKFSKYTKGPQYKTSYDCSKASIEVERFICRVEELAGLDVKLNAEYVNRLKKIDKIKRAALIKEQRKWIKERNEIRFYKWEIKTLRKMYLERIKKLAYKDFV